MHAHKILATESFIMALLKKIRDYHKSEQRGIK